MRTESHKDLNFLPFPGPLAGFFGLKVSNSDTKADKGVLFPSIPSKFHILEECQLTCM